jgi:hypothetical protein
MRKLLQGGLRMPFAAARRSAATATPAVPEPPSKQTVFSRTNPPSVAPSGLAPMMNKAFPSSTDPEDDMRDQDDFDYSEYAPREQFDESTRLDGRNKYGEGSYDLYRALYKELCDEMRREKHIRPPPPYRAWQAEHVPGTKQVSFVRPPAFEGDATVYAWGALELGDPSMMNEMLTFLSWHPIEACIVRGNHVMHFVCSCGEHQMHLRNIRVYHDEEGKLARPGVTSAAVEVAHIRQNLRYDGPFISHLEFDLQTEMWDLAMDHDINGDFLRFAADWIVFLEHVEYARWLRSMLEATVPGGIAEEHEVLCAEERMELDSVLEQWMPVREM